MIIKTRHWTLAASWCLGILFVTAACNSLAPLDGGDSDLDTLPSAILAPDAVYAGPDQTVQAGAQVELSAAPMLRGQVLVNGLDGGGDQADFQVYWTQLAGPKVALTTPAAPTTQFIAPEVDEGVIELMFQATLQVNNSTAYTDTIVVTVTPIGGEGAGTDPGYDIGRLPVSDPGDDVFAQAGELVDLDGSASYDPRGLPLMFAWLQRSGPDVELIDEDQPIAHFIAPDMGDDYHLAFTLQVDNGEDQDIATVMVHVMELMDAGSRGDPTPAGGSLSVDAGPDAYVPCGEDFILSGGTSGGDDASFLWVQTAGPPVDLETPDQPTTSFQAPFTSTGATLIFELIVFLGDTFDSDEVIIFVNPCEGGGDDGGGIPPTPPPDSDCVMDSECNDYNPCTDDTCQGGTCVHEDNTAVCDDGDFCNGLELCADGICQSGVNPCPGQFCNEEADVCHQCESDEHCDDDLFCNGVETCIDGSCQAGENPCPDQLCNEEQDTCYTVQCDEDADCDDGSFCNGIEICNILGNCVSGPWPCVGQMCNEVTDACVDCLSDADCDDGDFCNGAETCAAGSCVAGDPPCPGQACDPIQEECLSCLVSSDCYDGNPCTADVCLSSGNCYHPPLPQGTFCNDGVFCNGADTCNGYGSCSLHAGSPCASDETCNEGTDTCESGPDCESDSDCPDDGLFCNGDEVCESGFCTHTGSPCSYGEICDESSDSCETAPASTIYVDDNGEDQPGYNPGQPLGHYNNPYATIQAGFDAAIPGDTVMVREGLYYANSTSQNARVLSVDENEGGAPGAPITVMAAPGESVVVDGEVGGTCPLHLFESAGSYMVIEGFEFRNVQRSGVLIGDPAEHVTVRLCHIHDFSTSASTRPGIGVQGPCEYIVIEDNLIHGPGGVGIFLDESGGFSSADLVPPSGTGHYPEVPIDEWDDWPGYVGHAPRYCTVQRNIIYGMNRSAEGSDGLPLNYAIECTIQDNIIFANYDDNIDGLGATRCVFRRNILFDANPEGVEGGDGNGMKIGVRGALECVIDHNISFQNRRYGIDNALNFRGYVYNNTCVNNRVRGFSTGGDIAQMRENPTSLKFKNNLFFDGDAYWELDGFAAGKAGHLDPSLIDASNNAVNDDNVHGPDGLWSIDLGSGSFIELNPNEHLAEYADGQRIEIDTDLPAGTIPQKWQFIYDQVIEKLRLKAGSDLIDAGVQVPGITQGYEGSAPDIGAIETQ